MFKHFGRALRKSLGDFWDTAEESEREEIEKLYGNSLLKESTRAYFKNNNFLPNFENIIFVEGIAGSGKSTGVLKTLSRVLANSNPDFVQ
jgi:excinuclease UvrABC ATPase subunit